MSVDLSAVAVFSQSPCLRRNAVARRWSRCSLHLLIALLVNGLALGASIAHAQTMSMDPFGTPTSFWWHSLGGNGNNGYPGGNQGEGPTCEAAAEAAIANKNDPGNVSGARLAGRCTLTVSWACRSDPPIYEDPDCTWARSTAMVVSADGTPLGSIIIQADPCDPDNPAQVCPSQPTDPASDSDKAIGQPAAGNGVGDPIDTSNGNVYRHETDLQFGRWLSFERTYNSQAHAAGSVLGPKWTHPWARTVRYQAGSNGANDRAYVTLEDGKVVTYVRVNDQWNGEADVADTLQWTHDDAGHPVSWTLTHMGTGTVDTYGAQGELTQVTTADGFVLRLSYNNANQLSRITDPQGRSLTLTYDAQNRLQSVVAPDQTVVTYAYDAQNQLASVTLPSSAAGQPPAQQIYLYDESGHTQAPAAHRLTGVLDETGARVATYDYQADGRAIRSALGAGTQTYTIQYNADGSSSTTDPLGITATRQYAEVAGVSQLSQLSGPCESCGSIAGIVYDDHGQPTTLTDFNGQRTTVAYDSSLREIDRTEAVDTPAQRHFLTTWANTNQPSLREVRDANDHPVARTAWQYNARGQLLAQCEIDPTQTSTTTCEASGTAPAGVRRWTYTYCDIVDAVQCPMVGLMLTATGPRTDTSQTTRYSYYLSSSAVNCGTPGSACYQTGDLRAITNAAGQVTTIASYDGASRITRITDANNVNTDLTYTPRGWLASRSVDGAAFRFTYTPYGAIQSIADPDNVTLTYGYDLAQRLVKVTDAVGNLIQYTLDDAGHKTSEQVYDANGNLRKRQTQTFNALGQLSQIVDGLNNPVFDARANNSYDANGNLLQSTDALGIQRKLGYDALNRLVQTLDNYQGTDSATANTHSVASLDAMDRIEGVSDPDGLNTLYRYDGLGNAIQLSSPDSGITQSTYDAAGNLIQRTDARGITQAYTYDALNRVKTEATGNASEAVSYAYDEANSVTGCARSNPIGRLTRVVESTVTTTYCYDAMGRVIQKRQVQGTQTDTLSYTFTPAGRLSAIMQPSGTQVTYSRNTLGQVIAISATTAGGFNATLASNVTYLPFGPIASYTLGNGQSIVRTYDANYRITDLASPAITVHYTRDAAGTTSGIVVNSGTAALYSYDPLYRLSSTQDANGTALESYTYNQTGDRLSKTSSGTSTGAYGYQANTHWLTSVGSDTRSYDADGNMIASTSAGETWGYGYDGYNRMTTLLRGGRTAATYTYNAFGERIAKAVTIPSAVNQRFVYNEAGQLVAEYGTDSDGSSNTNRDHIWLGSVPIATLNKGDNASVINYITADGQDTPRVLTSSTGTVIWNWPIKGNPFGDKQPAALAGYAYNLRFAGQYYDAEAGLYYNVHRYYAPGSGRYTQVDPLGLVAGMSTYAYVGGNPISYVDPFGLWQVTATVSLLEIPLGGTLTFGYNHGQFNIGGWLGVAEGESVSVNLNDLPCHEKGSFRSTRADGKIGILNGLFSTNFSAQYGPQVNSTEFTSGVPFVKPLETGFAVDNGKVTQEPIVNIVGGGSVSLGYGAQWYF
jgi:RHS repeat-associated protein